MRSLLDRSRLPRRLDLTELERALDQHGLEPDLDAALTSLGHPPSVEAIERRRRRQQTSALRTVLDREVRCWPEAWAEQWLADLIASGLTGGVGVELVADVRRLLDALTNPLVLRRLGTDRDGLRSRTDLAALVFGSAHALDTSTALQRAAVRALALAQGMASDEPRAVWATQTP